MLFVNSAIVSLRKAGTGCVNGPSVPVLPVLPAPPAPPAPIPGTVVPAAPLPGPLGEPPGPLTLPTQPAAASAETATVTPGDNCEDSRQRLTSVAVSHPRPLTVLTRS